MQPLLSRKEVLLAGVGAALFRPGIAGASFFHEADGQGLVAAALGWDAQAALQRVGAFAACATPAREAAMTFVLCGAEPREAELAAVLRQVSGPDVRPMVGVRDFGGSPSRAWELARALEAPIIIASNSSDDALADVVRLGHPLAYSGACGLDPADFDAVCGGRRVGRMFQWVDGGEVPALPTEPVTGALLVAVGGRAVSLLEFSELVTRVQAEITPEAELLFQLHVEEVEAPLRCWLVVFLAPPEGR